MTAMKQWFRALTILLAGCAADPDSTTYYLLSDTQVPTRQCSAQLGTVSMPGYLNKSNIAVQGSGNQLIYANTHRWAEPLASSLKRELRACLGNGEKPIVDVFIDHFHGATNGRTVLAGSWRIRGADAAQIHSETLAQQGVGYDAMVDSQRTLIQGLCSQICSNLEQAESQSQP